MRQSFAKNAGLAAVILLAPGGFILGAALLADRYRKKGSVPTPPPGPLDDVGEPP